MEDTSQISLSYWQMIHLETGKTGSTAPVHWFSGLKEKSRSQPFPPLTAAHACTLHVQNCVSSLWRSHPSTPTQSSRTVRGSESAEEARLTEKQTGWEAGLPRPPLPAADRTPCMVWQETLQASNREGLCLGASGVSPVFLEKQTYWLCWWGLEPVCVSVNECVCGLVCECVRDQTKRQEGTGMFNKRCDSFYPQKKNSTRRTAWPVK